MTLRIERSPFNKLYKIIKGDGKPLNKDNWKTHGLGLSDLKAAAPSYRVEKELGTLWFVEPHDAQAAKKIFEES